MSIISKVNEVSDFLISKGISSPEIAIILGSGLGALAERVEDPLVINYEDIPSFPISTVEGHVGRLIYGTLSGKRCLLMQGRFHYYEGHSINDVVFPIRVMAKLGIRILIVSNAAGGINKKFVPGDLMLIKDHINFCGVNPLKGKNIDSLGVRFPDMSDAYSKSLRKLAAQVAKKQNIPLRKGVYFWVTGPSYETPAEINMARILGADAVGMSTVPEVIVANHAGIQTLGISCITNMAAGILKQKLNHEEVMEAAEASKENFQQLIMKFIEDVQVNVHVDE